MTKTHFLGLDATRGVAAICVALLHIQMYYSKGTIFLPHAYLAVDFFFMLSGFVLAHSYEPKFSAGMTWHKFMRIRFIRLFPLLIAGIIAGIAYTVLRNIFVPQYATPAPELFTAIAFGLLLVPNFLENGTTLNAPSWSIFFELVANAFYRLLGRKISDTSLLAIILAFVAVLAVIAYFSDWQGVEIPANRSLVANRAIGFLLMGSARVGFCFFVGVWLYRLFSRQRISRSISVHPLIASIVLVGVFCAPDAFPDTYNFLVTVIVFPILIVAAASFKPADTWATLSKIGGWISYPLYATHMPIAAITAAALVHFRIYELLSPTMRVSSILGVAIIVAAVLGKFFDDPIRAFLARRVASKRRASI